MTLYDEVQRYLRFVENVRVHEPDFLRFATSKDREREAARQILCKWMTRHLDGTESVNVYWTAKGHEMDEFEGIDEGEARTLAGYWHGGQTSPLYAFCSTGTITDGLTSEIESCLEHVASSSAKEELLQLKAYVMSVANFTEEDDGA